MDPRNLFHTPAMYRIVRAEHILVLGVCSALAAWNFNDIRWWPAIVAFWSIDLIGYLPGMLAYKRSNTNRINAWYHHAYNVCHTYLVTGAGVAIWANWIGGFEWAMLAVPIHLSIDRGVFGNTLKPVGLSFEPAKHSDEQVLRAMGRRPIVDDSVFDLDGGDSRCEHLVPPDSLAAFEHPSGFLALARNNRRFGIANVPGLICYRQRGKHLWIFGGVHAAGESAAEILRRFVDFATTKRCRVAAVQVRADQVELFASQGFQVNQMGSNFAVSLQGYSLSGSKKMQLRNKINRARKAGLRVVELGIDVPRTPEWFDKLNQISQAWLTNKGKPELEFMVGELGHIDEVRRRIFLVLDADERPQAFITYVPVPGGQQSGYLHDLTRKVPDAPPGTMELCNATAIERFQKEKVSHLHFGFTPLIVDDEPHPHACRWIHHTMLAIRKYGRHLYSADSQAAYKEKWGTDIIEREYAAVRPMSMRAMVDFLLLTRSV